MKISILRIMYISVLKSEIGLNVWKVRSASSSLSAIRRKCIKSALTLAKRNHRKIGDVELRSCATGRSYDCVIYSVPNFVISNLAAMNQLQSMDSNIEI